MRPLPLLLIACLAVPASAGVPDPVQQASDWQAVIQAHSRTGGVPDPKSCSACVGAIGDFPGCRAVPVSDLIQQKMPEQACTDTCKVESAIAYDKIVERMRADPKCAADCANTALIKRTSEDMGMDIAPDVARCGDCVTPADIARWPERRRALFQLHGRLGEALGKTDAASRAAALKPLLAEAAAQFNCAGDKIDAASCKLKR